MDVLDSTLEIAGSLLYFFDSPLRRIQIPKNIR